MEISEPAPARLRVAIVDDEPLARGILREYLSKMTGVEIAAECANGFDAVKAVAEQSLDLILLDVQMPKLDGFEVLELIGGDTPVIFVTAYDMYAIRAFDVHAVDYLLKPFSQERLAEAMERARLRLGRGETAPAREIAAFGPTRGAPLERILVRDRADVHVVPVGQVDYIESQDDYAAIWTGGRSLLKEQTLAELEALLDPRAFVRVHRRYILNVARLVKIETTASESRVALLADGSRLPISRAGYARLRDHLE